MKFMPESEISKIIDGSIVRYNRITDQIHEQNAAIDLGSRTNVMAERDVCIELTSKCNFQCKNCFSENHSKNIDFSKLEIWIEENISRIIRICLSGGEPILYPKIMSVIEHISKYDNIGKVINSNGALIEEKHISLFKQFNWTVAISLHGTESTHGRYTNSSSYQKIIQTIRDLNVNGVNTHIYSVLHRDFTIDDLHSVIDIKRTHNVSILRAIRVRPHGRNEPHVDENIESAIRAIKNEGVFLKTSASKSIFLTVDNEERVSN